MASPSQQSAQQSRADALREALSSRVVVADGAMGTMLQAQDPSLDDFQGHEGCNEVLNVTRPDIVRAVHDAYLEVGVDCVETNTFGANLAALAEYGIADRIHELAEAGARPPALSERQALSLLTPAPTSRGFYFLARERGATAKTTFVLLKLAPPPAFMRLRYPLARRGPVGLGLAYLYRPFWLLRWFLPGLRSWRDARRPGFVGTGPWGSKPRP